MKRRNEGFLLALLLSSAGVFGSPHARALGPDVIELYIDTGAEHALSMADVNGDGRVEIITASKGGDAPSCILQVFGVQRIGRAVAAIGPEVIFFPSTGGFGALWVVAGDFNGDRRDEVLALYSIPIDRPYGEKGGTWPGSLPERLQALKSSKSWTRSFYRSQAGPLAVYLRDPARPFPTRGDFKDAWTNTQPWTSPGWTLETWIFEPAVEGAIAYSNPGRLHSTDKQAVVALGSKSLVVLARSPSTETRAGEWNIADVGLQTPIVACALGDLTGDGKAEVAALGKDGAILCRSIQVGSHPGQATSPVEVVRSNAAAPSDPFEGAAPTLAKTVFGQPSGRLALDDPSRDGKNELILAVRAKDRGVLVSYQRRAYGPGMSMDGKGTWDFELVDTLRPGEVFMDALVADYNADGAPEILASTNRGRLFAYRRAEAGYRPGNMVPLHDFIRRTLYKEKDLVINSLACGDTDGDPSNGHEIAFSVSPGSPQIPVPWGHYLLYNTAP